MYSPFNYRLLNLLHNLECSLMSVVIPLFHAAMSRLWRLVCVVLVVLCVTACASRPKSGVWDTYDTRHVVPEDAVTYDNDSYYTPPSGYLCDGSGRLDSDFCE